MQIAESAPIPRTPDNALTMSLLGVSISVLAGGEDTDQITILDYTSQPGAPGPVLHWHKQATEWFHVLEGQFTFEVNGREVTALPNSLVLVPPRTLHRFWNSATTASRMTVGFNRGGMEKYFAELFDFVKGQPVWPPREISKLEEIAERYDTYIPGKL